VSKKNLQQVFSPDDARAAAVAATQHEAVPAIPRIDSLLVLARENGWTIDTGELTTWKSSGRIWFKRGRERVYMTVAQTLGRVTSAHGFVIAGARAPWSARGPQKAEQLAERLQRAPLAVTA
jgi:hypothetical protein